MHWHDVSAQGVVYSATTVSQPTFPIDQPEVLAIVELDAGPRLPTALVVGDPVAVRVGDRVVGVFDHVDAGHTLLRFAVDRAHHPDR